MGVDRVTLSSWLADYDKDNLTIGVVASHSSLQILHGARKEGFRTLGIAVGENRRKIYQAFPGADPDEWLILEDYREMLDYAENLNFEEAAKIRDKIKILEERELGINEKF